MDPAFGERHLNEGFSGGEKKRNEILQMAMLEPELAILDETDSGLDVDALRTVARGVHTVRESRPELGVLVISHYQRMLEELDADRVHLLVDGVIVDEGGPGAGRPPRGRGVRRMAELTAADAGRTGAGRRHAGQGLPPARPRGARATPSPTSTRPRRRSGPPPSSTPCASTTRPPMPTCTAASTPSPRRPPAASRRPGPTSGRFIGAPDPAREVVFTKNATEALNLVAHTWGRPNLGRGRRGGADRDGAPRQHRPLAHAGRRAGHRAPLAARSTTTAGWSSTTSTAVLDGAKLLGGHLHVQRAGHAQPGGRAGRRPPTPPAPWSWPTPASPSPTCPPTWPPSASTSWPSAPTRCSAPPASACCGAARSCSAELPPFLGGGEMILDVRKDGFTPNDIPWRFEAGTPPITEAVGLGAAVDYLAGRRHGRRPGPRDRRSPPTPSTP